MTMDGEEKRLGLPWREDGGRLLSDSRGHAPTPQHPEDVVAQCFTFCCGSNEDKRAVQMYIKRAANSYHTARKLLEEADWALHQTEICACNHENCRRKRAIISRLTTYLGEEES